MAVEFNNIKDDIDNVGERIVQNSPMSRGLLDHRKVDFEAEKICKSLSYNLKYKAFICKALYKIPLARVHTLVEIAKEKGRDPAKYLSFLLARELEKSDEYEGRPN